jgi:uncharacterized caspase-like protein
MKKRAFIVGINSYLHVDSLTCCEQDAQSMEGLFSHNGNGEDNFSVRCLTSVDGNITKAHILNGFKQLVNGSPDVVVFFFSGHGSKTDTGYYLLTSEARKADEGISMHEIMTLASKSNAKYIIILLDCCHAAGMGAITLNNSDLDLLSNGICIMAACGANETTIENREVGHGSFTYRIIRGLEGSAADTRGNITIGGLYSFVAQETSDWEEDPLLKTSIKGSPILRTVALAQA